MKKQNFLPTYKQYQKWSLPSKLTLISTFIGILSLLLTVFTLLFSKNISNTSKNNLSHSVVNINNKNERTVKSTNFIYGHFTNQLIQQKLIEKIYAYNEDFLNQTYLTLDLSGKEIYESIDYSDIYYVGCCYDETDQLDHLIYYLHDGMSNRPADAAFIYYNRDTNQFIENIYLNAGRYIQENYDDRVSNEFFEYKNEKIICKWKSLTKYETLLKDIFLLIRPTKKPLIIKQSITSFKLKIKTISNELFSQIRDKDFLNIGIHLLYENNHWQIYNIEYVDIECNAWGVLIAKNKLSNELFSFYNTPTSKNSKRIIYTPILSNCYENKFIRDILTENQICLQFCFDCYWWGEYGNYIIDLKEKKVISEKSFIEYYNNLKTNDSDLQNSEQIGKKKFCFKILNNLQIKYENYFFNSENQELLRKIYFIDENNTKNYQKDKYDNALSIAQARLGIILLYKDLKSVIKSNICSLKNIHNTLNKKTIIFQPGYLFKLFNIKIIVKELILYYNKIVSVNNWSEKMININKSLMSKRDSEPIHIIFHKSGFPISENHYNMLPVDFIFIHEFILSNEGWLYSFWLRRYLEGNFQITYKVLNALYKLL